MDISLLIYLSLGTVPVGKISSTDCVNGYRFLPINQRQQVFNLLIDGLMKYVMKLNVFITKDIETKTQIEF